MPKLVPRCLQYGTNMAPKRRKRVPKRVPKGPNMPPEGPKLAQVGPKMASNGSQVPQDTFRMSRVGLMVAPRRP